MASEWLVSGSKGVSILCQDATLGGGTQAIAVHSLRLRPRATQSLGPEFRVQAGMVLAEAQNTKRCIPVGAGLVARGVGWSK